MPPAKKAVQTFTNTSQTGEKQHQPWVARVTQQLLAACREWDTLLAGRAAARRPDQVTVTSTVVWTFIQSMIPNVVLADDFKNIASLARSCEALPAFKNIPYAKTGRVNDMIH